MVENKVNETAWNLTESLRETTQAVAQTAIAAQERNMAYVQNIFENGIEVLKSHAESSRNLVHEQTELSRKQQVDFQSVFNGAIAAQERNLRYAQSTIENGTEVLKSHIQATRDLMQQLTEQTQKQQGLYQELARETTSSYLDFMFAPFAYYQQAVDTAGSIARQGVETAQNITRQSWEAAQRAAQQAQEAAQSVSQ